MDIRFIDSKGSEISSLLKISLDFICSNIKFFNKLYLISKNPCQQNNLLFLCRFYSEYIIRKRFTPHHFLRFKYDGLCRFSSDVIDANAAPDIFLEKEYFGFLLNEYLTTLNMSIFYECDWNAAISRLKKMGYAISKAEFVRSVAPSGYDSSGYDERKRKHREFVEMSLSHLPNLKSLSIDVTYACNDATLSIIFKNCKTLTELTVITSTVTSEGIQTMCSTNRAEVLNLQKLSLSSMCKVFDGNTFLLQNFRHLDIQCRDLPQILYNLHIDQYLKGCLKEVGEYNISHLHYFCNQSDESEVVLSIAAQVCPRVACLSALELSSSEEFVVLTNFRELRCVDLAGRIGTFTDCTEFLQRSRASDSVEYLKLTYASLTVADLICKFPNLKELDIWNSNLLMPETSPETPSLRKLTKLNLKHFRASDPTNVESLSMLLSCTPALEAFRYSKNERLADESDTIIQIFSGRSFPLRELTFHKMVSPRLVEFFVRSFTSLRRINFTCALDSSPSEIQKIEFSVQRINSLVKISADFSDWLFWA